MTSIFLVFSPPLKYKISAFIRPTPKNNNLVKSTTNSILYAELVIRMIDFKKIKGIVFDKDGTLFDFSLSWTSWATRIITVLSKNNNVETSKLADALGFDLNNNRFKNGSDFIAGTVAETAKKISQVIPNKSEIELEDFLILEATNQSQTPVKGLESTLLSLNRNGFILGVATNDAEGAAISHLKNAKIYEHFDFVVGYDSGFGSKPDPGQIIAFCTQMNLKPNEVLMIGDSTHDLIAGMNAGTIPIGVLTGPAVKADLKPYSSRILNSIADLIDLLKLKATKFVEN